MSMAYVAVAVAVIGAAVSATSAVMQGNAAKDAADYNAKVQRNAAQDALQRGADNAAEHREKVRQLKSQQLTMTAAGGMETNSGTAMDLLTETAGMGELDALRIVDNAQRQAAGLEAQANLDEFQGRVAQTSGYMSATSSLLSGASNAYFGYKAAQK